MGSSRASYTLLYIRQDTIIYKARHGDKPIRDKDINTITILLNIHSR